MSETSLTFQRVKIGLLHPDPRQSRKSHSQGISGLADTVEHCGVLHPLLVRPRSDGDGYYVMAGSRRLAALRMLHEREPENPEYAEVWVHIRQADDIQALEQSVIENLQRENLNPMDLSDAVRALREIKEEQDGPGTWSLERIGKHLGRSKAHISHVYNYREKLHPELQEEASMRRLNIGWATFLSSQVPMDEQSYWFWRGRKEGWDRETAAAKYSLRKKLANLGVPLPVLPPLDEPWVEVYAQTPDDLAALLTTCRSILEYLTSLPERDQSQDKAAWRAIRTQIAALYRMSEDLRA